MIKRIIIFFFLLPACTHPVKNKSDWFIISSAMPAERRPPALASGGYAEANLLIDSSGRFYYYQQPDKGVSYLDEEESAIPPYIHLLPGDMVEIPQGGLTAFLGLNLPGPTDLPGGRSRKHVLAIGLEKDSIYNPVISQLKKVFAQTNIIWIARKLTQEESFVLSAKIRGAYYDPEGQAWDSSRIRFLPTLNDMKKFTTPRIDKP